MATLMSVGRDSTISRYAEREPWPQTKSNGRIRTYLIMILQAIMSFMVCSEVVRAGQTIELNLVRSRLR